MAAVAVLQDAEFWVGAALLIFVGILVWAKAPAMAARVLDARGVRVRSHLDEARRLREEAQALLAEITRRHAESEQAAEEMLKTARADAERLRAEAAIKLEEDIQRRRALAERRIAMAETQAAADVKAAAVDLATSAAEAILASRVGASGSDRLIDAGLKGLAERFS
jgi:F-type H+-transporting ATPase subunit b